MTMKTSKFGGKIHDNDAKLKKVYNIVDGSWGMDWDHMGYIKELVFAPE